MKKLLPILFVLIITSCSKEVPLEQTVERNGITYEVNSEEPLTGTTVLFHENGQLSYKGNFKDGKMEGLWEGYHQNGQVHYKGNYKDGERDGLWESYDVNGNLESKDNYKDGELEVFFIEK